MPVVTNLLRTPDLDPPMGDLFSFRTLSEVRSIWTTPRPEEPEAPERRIVHARVFTPPGRAVVHRIAWQGAPGYHKCGSRQENDWVVDVRILTLDAPDAEWRQVDYLRDLPPASGWLELEPFITFGLVLEVRRCGIDDYWTPWNLAAEAFSVEGHLEDPVAPRRERLLEVRPPALDGLPNGLQAECRDGQVFFRSRWLQVGFVLGRPACSHLALDQEGEGRVDANLLKIGPGSFHQGPMLSPLGRAPAADPAVRFDFTGETEVRGNRVIYRIGHQPTGQRYEIQWTVETDRLTLELERHGSKPLRAWHSAAWRFALDPQVTPCHLLADPNRSPGQTGSVISPALFHAPGQGSFAVRAEGAAVGRLEVFRPRDRIDWELKCGEEPMPEGDWMLAAGRHRACWQWTVHPPQVALRKGTPAVVQAAVRRVGHTGLSFRPDTATLSNNGASMHCPISMDTWSTQTVRMGELLPGLSANVLLQASLERWLDGGPGYAAGNLKQDGLLHSGEDEYLMTGTAALLGLAEFIQHSAPPAWVDRHRRAIERKLHEMRARDLDNDGLIESAYRTGTSGSGQWSTAWFDVISFGWKDAFSNALLGEALMRLTAGLRPTALADWVKPLEQWYDALKGAFAPTFYNPDTGWLAGWRCRDGRLHDYAFLPPNGAAVAAGLIEPETARGMMERLLGEMHRVGVPSARLGMPGNLHPIPDEDRADIIQGYPFGYYQNGGRTHAQARHFLRGLYATGFGNEADALLLELCQGLADAAVFGGCKSGVDWRHWDDRPCGYEGLLTDQFGVLGVVLERYGDRGVE